MEIQADIRNALQALGGEVSLEKDGAVYLFSACIQPDAYQTQEGSRSPQTRFGKADPRQYLYYGPLENGGELVEDGTLLKQGETVYLVQLCHDFFWQGKAVYRRAVLKRQED